MINVPQQHFHSYLSYLPVLTPAINKATCRIDHDLVEKRIMTIAAAAFCSLAASMILAPSFSLFTAFCLFIIPVEKWHNKRCLEQFVIHHYLKEQFPSEQAFLYILRSPHVVQQLVLKGADFNKKTAGSMGFLDFWSFERIDFDVFKILVSQGFDWKQFKSGKAMPYFQYLVACKDPRYLEHVLQTGNIQAVDYSDEQQFEFWLNLHHPKTATLLVQHGFDINVRDKNQYTPLLKLIHLNSQQGPLLDLFKLSFIDSAIHHMADLIAVLLDAGANPSATAWIQAQTKNAWQLNTDPEIKKLLDKRKLMNVV